MSSQKSVLLSIIAAILGSLYGCAQNNYGTLFAKIKGESYEFTIDTLAFKKSISNNLFSKESTGTYNRIEIQKLKTIGNENKDYYCVILFHHGKNLKTARYLVFNDGKLYLNNDNSFNSIYNSCIGIESKCSPNVSINSKLEMGWICSNEVGICSIDKKECQTFKSIILD